MERFLEILEEILKYTLKKMYILKMCEERIRSSNLQELILLANSRSKLYLYGKPKCRDFAIDELIFYESFQPSPLLRAPTQTGPSNARLIAYDPNTGIITYTSSNDSGYRPISSGEFINSPYF